MAILTRSFENFSTKCNHCIKFLGFSLSTVFSYSRTAIRNDYLIDGYSTSNHPWIAVFAIGKMIRTDVLTFARFVQMFSSVSIDESQLTRRCWKGMFHTNTRPTSTLCECLLTSSLSKVLQGAPECVPSMQRFLAHDRNRFVDENQDYSREDERTGACEPFDRDDSKRMSHTCRALLQAGIRQGWCSRRWLRVQRSTWLLRLGCFFGVEWLNIWFGWDKGVSVEAGKHGRFVLFIGQQ